MLPHTIAPPLPRGLVLDDTPSHLLELTMHYTPTRTTKATVHHAGRDEMVILGRATRIREGRPETMFGLCDSSGEHLTLTSHSMWTAPTVQLLEGMQGVGGWLVIWHGNQPGQEITIEAAELRRVFLELDLMASAEYRGVPVPDALVHIWTEPEADWWRRGVDEAVNHAESSGVSVSQMVGKIRNALQILHMEGEFAPDTYGAKVESLADIVRSSVRAVESAGAHVDLMNDCCGCSNMELYVQLGEDIAKVEL